jgi:hypothetical protein
MIIKPLSEPIEKFIYWFLSIFKESEDIIMIKFRLARVLIIPFSNRISSYNILSVFNEKFRSCSNNLAQILNLCKW